MTLRRRRFLLGAAALVLVLGAAVIDRCIETRRERVTRLLDRCQDALESRDFEAVARLLCADFNAQTLMIRADSRDGAIARLRRLLDPVTTIRIERDRLEVVEEQGEVVVQVVAAVMLGVEESGSELRLALRVQLSLEVEDCLEDEEGEPQDGIARLTELSFEPLR